MLLPYRFFLGVMLAAAFPVMAQVPPNKVPPAPVFEQAPTLPVRIPDSRTEGLESKPVRTLPLSSQAIGTLTPESGKWHSFVAVKGPNFARAERVAVIWYPNDDASKPQAGSITATLRKRTGTDEIEIEMPRDAGGDNGGVVRVYLTMPTQLRPVLAGRFTVRLVSENLPPFVPMSLDTEPFKMTGVRLPPFVPVSLVTAPFQMTGVRQPAFVPMSIQTAPFQMTGVRLKRIEVPNKVPLTDLQPTR